MVRVTVTAPRALVAIALLSLVLRCGLAIVLWDQPLHGDETAYDAVARNLLAGKGFSTTTPIGLVNPGHDTPSSLWGCLQPLWLAANYRLFGTTSGGPVFLSNAVLGVVPVLSAAYLGTAAGGPLGGVLAAGTIAIDPYLVRLGATRLSEPLYTALLWLAMASLWRWRSDGTLLPALGAGAFLGLASLSRGSAFYLGVALLTWRVIDRPMASAPGRLAIQVAVCVAALSLIIAPWVMRNRRVHDPPVFLDTKAGWNLYSYLHPEFDPAALSQPPIPEGLLSSGLSESARNQLLLSYARGFAGRDPWRVLRLGVDKLVLMWSPMPGIRTDPGWAGVKFAFVTSLEIVAILGLLRGGLRSPLGRLLAVLLGFHLLLHAVMMGGPRFRAPLDPALAVLGAFACRGRGGGWLQAGTPHGDAESAAGDGPGSTGQTGPVRV